MKISNAMQFITPLILTTSFGALAQTKDNKTISNKAEIFKSSNINTPVKPKSSSPLFDSKSPLNNKVMNLDKGSSRPQGGVATGGGDAYSQNFVQTGWAIYSELLLKKANSNISLPALRNAILTVEVISTDYPLFLNGDEKDALNEPSLNRITINRKRWQENEHPQRKAIALHEYLRFLKVDDSKYQVSGPLLARLAKEPTSQLIDALADLRGQANVIFSFVGKERPEAICYNIAMLNPSVSKIKSLIKAQFTLPKPALTTGATERLDVWNTLLGELCLYGRAQGPLETYQQANNRTYKEALLLVMRESEILLSWIHSQRQNTPFEFSEISRRYADEISNL